MLLTRVRRPRSATAPRMPWLTRLFWIYFLLLIFEGALRKWILSPLSGPLLLVRDPIALAIIWEAYRTHKWPRQWGSVIAVLSLGMLGLAVLQVIVAQNPWFVAAYGLRSYLLPFPVAFIMAENLTVEDLRKFGKCTLWLLLPLTALEVAQYYAGGSSFLNKAVSEGSTQLAYAGGHVRPSATFSYTTGPAAFIPLAAAFVIYGIVNPGFVKKWLLWAAAGALVIAIPVTGSRTLLVLLALLIVCVAVAAMFGISHLAGLAKILFALLLVGLVASQLSFVSDATATFRERISNAEGSEGGVGGTISERGVVPIVESLETGFTSVQWYGEGLGMGSNVAATLLTGTQQFLAGEGEFQRVIFEFGGPIGLGFILFRLMLGIIVTFRALSSVRERQPLAWFLIPITWTVLLGTLEQPTIQGFMVVCLGFSLAATKVDRTRVEIPMMLNRRLSRV